MAEPDLTAGRRLARAASTGVARVSRAGRVAAGGSRFVLRRTALAARLGALAVRAPKDPHVAWRRFWADVRTDGDRGEVLWDSEDDAEIGTYRALAAEYLDPALPLLDLGCGNGRFTRALAGAGTRVVGVDVAEAAVDRASALLDADDPGRVSYLALDITAPDAGERLRERYGEANVFLRGVLHVLTPAERLDAARTVGAVLGRGGRALIAETDFRGSLLAYAEKLGATPRHVPVPLAKAVSGLPQPRHFGATELAAAFPAADFEVLLARPTRIGVVPMRGGAAPAGGPQDIPGFLAVLAGR